MSRQHEDYNYTPEQRQRMAMRKKRVALRRKKERRKRLLFAAGILIFVLICIGGISSLRKKDKNNETDETIQANQMTNAEMASANSDALAKNTDQLQGDNAENGADSGQTADGSDAAGQGVSSGNGEALDSSAYQFAKTDNTVGLNSAEVTSTYALVANATTNQMVAQKNAYDRINPASMTKILTLLVACENITNPDDTFTMTLDITDYAYVHDCSSVGFLDGEKVTVRDLLYGTILPSGGDAAVGLATYVAGSQEAFVDKMNQKLADLGLSQTAHFTNCVGLYDENHYCTIYDMAVILNAAMKNEQCREILNTRTYTTSATEQHPEGITVSNWFLRRIEDKDMGGKIMGAKTGYVVQSGNCAASFYERDDGNEFICVTADAHSGWRAIYDHVAAYNIYAAGNTSYTKQ